MQDPSKGDVAVFLCGEANGNGGETDDLTALEAPEQYVLLDAFVEFCEKDVVHALYVLLLREDEAASDQSGNTVDEKDSRFGGGRFIQQQRDGDCVLVGHDSAIFSCPEMDS